LTEIGYPLRKTGVHFEKARCTELVQIPLIEIPRMETLGVMTTTRKRKMTTPVKVTERSKEIPL
jgi:hypothetical protein